jgi:hypothetical protein
MAAPTISLQILHQLRPHWLPSRANGISRVKLLRSA